MDFTVSKKQIKMPKATKSNITSTPTDQVYNVRESLGLIKKNTVLGMVHLFNQSEKLTTSVDFDPKSTSSPPSLNITSCFDDLEAIKETSSHISIDSGYDSISFRRRSKSCGKRSIRDSIIDSYAEYPNFKWKYLKYFGVDPKEYLSRFDINLDQSAIDEDPKNTIGNSGGDGNDGVKVFELERSQTFRVNKRSGDQLSNQNATKKHRGNEVKSAVTLVNAKTGRSFYSKQH